MHQIIKEYGMVFVASVECVALFGILGYLCVCIADYMECFADRLMGG